MSVTEGGLGFTWSDFGSSDQRKRHVKPDPDRLGPEIFRQTLNELDESDRKREEKERFPLFPPFFPFMHPESWLLLPQDRQTSPSARSHSAPG
ncbi:hypothetical protein HMPREF9374_1415 [Desmospora sp. 8437]|nr:hypothetical protein HMPREF9374_1415 [Desmospora sp. 8437]